METSRNKNGSNDGAPGFHLWAKRYAFSIGFLIGIIVLAVVYWKRLIILMATGDAGNLENNWDLVSGALPFVLGAAFHAATFLLPKVKCPKCGSPMKIKRSKYFFYKCADCGYIMKTGVKTPEDSFNECDGGN